MKYSKENPKMLSPRQNTDAHPTSMVLIMWEMGCMSWCLSMAYQWSTANLLQGKAESEAHMHLNQDTNFCACIHSEQIILFLAL